VGKGAGLVPELITRIVLVALCGGAGTLSVLVQGGGDAEGIAAAAVGVAFGLLVVALEVRLRRIGGKAIFYALLGLVVGLLVGHLFSRSLISLLGAFPPFVTVFAETLCLIGGAYVGSLVVLEKGREFNFAGFIRLLKEQPRAESYKLLDTSVIIDGRIADITETGFLEGTLIIPQFILRELQHIADSSDPLKRNRGRRGLDILQKIQKKVGIRVEISDMDFPEIREVDNKLVAMAKALNAKIVTNDFNLNKVAELHGVGVLNINELTNALRPVVLPGEDMRVYVLKEGKEYNQGIAYLDDGTMVVVDNGRRHIGQTIDVCVTSVLQTTAGRMIFSRLKEEAEAA
jgi:uncharacterized protein YacL